jgi:hypothetical protein
LPRLSDAPKRRGFHSSWSAQWRRSPCCD